ncbi:MAG: TolC family protein [Candidatus Omnitrophota bacterium]
MQNKKRSSVFKKFCVIFLGTFACLSFASLTLSAEDQQEPQRDAVVLSIADTIETAYRSNIAIQIQESQIKSAQAGIVEAKSYFMPKVNLDGSYTHNNASLGSSITAATNSKKDIGTIAGYQDSNELGVSVTESVYQGGANRARFKESEVNLRIEQETLRAQKLDVAFEAKRLFYGLLLAYETSAIMEDLLFQAQAHYEDTKHMFDQGTASRFDVLQSKVHVSTIVPEVVRAVNSIELIEAELKKLLTISLDDRLELKGTLVSPFIELDERSFLSEAYLEKPEMILKALGVDLSKWSIEMAKSTHKPQIDINAGYNYKSNDWADMFNKRHNIWTAGVAVTIPIFDGFYTKARVDAAKQRYAQAVLSEDDFSQQLAVDIKRACLDLKKAREIIISQEDTVIEAEEALKIAEISFSSGVATNLDVIDSMVSLSQVRENLCNGRYDYLMAKAYLDKTRGREFAIYDDDRDGSDMIAEETT